METAYEIIPFAKEMLRQKPSRYLLKVYLLGSVLAILGTVLGLVDTVWCQTFSSDDEALDAELALVVAREQRALERAEKRRTERVEMEKEKEVTVPKKQRQAQRNVSNRLHAS